MPTVPPPMTLLTWDSILELVLGGLSLICSLILFVYYSYEHQQIRATRRNSSIRQSLWTTDQVNACLIPLGISFAFGAAYLFLR